MDNERKYSQDLRKLHAKLKEAEMEIGRLVKILEDYDLSDVAFPDEPEPDYDAVTLKEQCQRAWEIKRGR